MHFPKIERGNYNSCCLKILICCGQRALSPQRPTVTNYIVFYLLFLALSSLFNFSQFNLNLRIYQVSL